MQLLGPAREFSAYGVSHWVILVLFAAGAVVLVAAGRRHGNTEAARHGARAVAITILVLKLATMIYGMVPPHWNVGSSLPLQLSDLAVFAAVYALWSQRHWAFALTYYWGLVLSTQALFTPTLQMDFPAADFFIFWGLHLFVVWVAIYLTWGVRIRPTWYSYRVVVAITTGWAVTVFVVNSVVGSNYGFLNRKPDTASLLDVLGPWPWYLLPVIGLVLGAWALMTWPWVRAGRAAAARS